MVHHFSEFYFALELSELN